MLGCKYFGGPVKYVLSGSGHIAGVVNPPAKHKYQYWTGPRPRSANVDGWLAKAKEHPGSWWPDWLAWLKAPGFDRSRRARSRRRRAQADRGRAGKLREGSGLGFSVTESAKSGPGYGNSATCSSPVVSGKPSMRFMF